MLSATLPLRESPKDELAFTPHFAVARSGANPEAVTFLVGIGLSNQVLNDIPEPGVNLIPAGFVEEPL